MLAPQEDQRRRDQRRARFTVESGAAPNESSIENMPIRGVVVGVCSVVEKEYLRLTAAPDPANVRPLRILKLALKKVKVEWVANHDYRYALSQLKSIRQDITVQHLKGKFVVEVYETHGRIAIEEADLGELRQCLSQLEFLYEAGSQGNKYEFLAYKLLDGLITCRGGVYNVELVVFLQRLLVHARQDACVQHALAVRTAVASNNYILFFRLWRSAPRLSGFLIDLLVDPLRVKAFRCVLTAYRPSVPLIMLQEQLGFDSLDDCRGFLRSQQAVMTSSNAVDTKLSLENLNEQRERAREQDSVRGPSPELQPLATLPPAKAKQKVKRKSLVKASVLSPVSLYEGLPAPVQKKAKTEAVAVIAISSDDSSSEDNAEKLKKLKKRIKRKKPKLKSELAAIKQQLTLTKNSLEEAKGNSAICKTLRKQVLKLKKQKLQVKIALQSVKTALTTTIT